VWTGGAGPRNRPNRNLPPPRRWENVVANAEDPMGFLDLRVQVNRPGETLL